MTFRVGYVGAQRALMACLLVGTACTHHDRAPFIDENGPAVVGSAGDDSGSSGGKQSKGQTADAGATTTSGAATGGAADDAKPGGVEAGLLDPGEVYIYGTLAEGSAGYDAVAHWSSPNTYLVGFDEHTDGQSLHMFNGLLAYTIVFAQGIRTFTPEFASTLKPIDLKYPKDPARNDPILETPPCLAQDTGPIDFLTSPDGRLIYLCPDKAWYEAGTKVYEGEDNLLAMGYDGLMLVGGFNPGVLNLKDGQRRSLDGITDFSNRVASRASHDGFHIVFQSKTGNDTPELWLIGADATTKRLDTYPLPPESIRVDGSGQLSANDELFQFGSGPKAFEGVIVRRKLDGTSSVVYDVATDPHVKLGISYLFTGP